MSFLAGRLRRDRNVDLDRGRERMWASYKNETTRERKRQSWNVTEEKKEVNWGDHRRECFQFLQTSGFSLVRVCVCFTGQRLRVCQHTATIIKQNLYSLFSSLFLLIHFTACRFWKVNSDSAGTFLLYAEVRAKCSGCFKAKITLGWSGSIARKFNPVQWKLTLGTKGWWTWNKTDLCGAIRRR